MRDEVDGAGFEARLGEVLVARGVVDREGLRRLMLARDEHGDELPNLAVKLGLAAERDMAQALGQVLGIPLAASSDYPAANGDDTPLPLRFMQHHRIVPIRVDTERLVLAMANPRDRYAIDATAMACARPVDAWVGTAADIDAAIERLYGNGKSQMGTLGEQIDGEEGLAEEDVAQLRDLASEAPVVRMVNLIIQRAAEMSASDIHLEPFENRLTLRYRIDGVLREMEAPPARSAAAVVSRIKLLARLDIAERRLPQDGRIKVRVQGRELDIRVSTAPTIHGEVVVMRLLNRQDMALDFDALGFAPDVADGFGRALQLPHGIILVTGPTGSGKTTTLYAALHKLNSVAGKIITVEDPVEYQLAGINQIEVKPAIGLTFANVLRNILRQDPDIIMVGEMRDAETARIAVRSALTGHLVLSTLHTNDAPSALTRLLDMGIEDYLLSSTVSAVLAQRLVRTLCTHCRVPASLGAEAAQALGLALEAGARAPPVYRAGGCAHCGGTGYRGRVAVVELMPMTDAVRRLVLRRAETAAIARAAIEGGMRTMYGDGMRKVVEGLTTVEEVLRVVQEG